METPNPETPLIKGEGIELQLEEDSGVRCFLELFLYPVFKDDKIDVNEETPLRAAFQILNIEDWFRQDEKAALDFFERRMTAFKDKIEHCAYAPSVEEHRESISFFSQYLVDQKSQSLIEWTLDWLRNINVLSWSIDENIASIEGDWFGELSATTKGLIITALKAERSREGPYAHEWGNTDGGFASSKSGDSFQRLLWRLYPLTRAPESVMLAEKDGAKPENLVAIEVKVDISASKTQEELRARLDGLTAWLIGGKPEWALGVENPGFSLVKSSGKVWFVGDVHGDLLGLEAALRHIDEKTPEASIVFLGDLFDRMEEYAFEVVLKVVSLIKERPGRILWLAGNHDVALVQSEANEFQGRVEPSEFSAWLNRQNTEVRNFGASLVKFIERLPKAILFTDGLLAAHGGVPHTDLLVRQDGRGIAGLDDLNSAECLQDFVWARLHPRAPKRTPNRNSKTCELGYKDFEAFCARMTDMGYPVRRMIRGHDHVPLRYDLYPNYKINQVLTLNTLTCRLDGEFIKQIVTAPCVALYRHGLLPHIHKLVLSEDVVRSWYPDRFKESAKAEEPAAELNNSP